MTVTGSLHWMFCSFDPDAYCFLPAHFFQITMCSLSLIISNVAFGKCTKLQWCNSIIVTSPNLDCALWLGKSCKHADIFLLSYIWRAFLQRLLGGLQWALFWNLLTFLLIFSSYLLWTWLILHGSHDNKNGVVWSRPTRGKLKQSYWIAFLSEIVLSFKIREWFSGGNETKIDQGGFPTLQDSGSETVQMALSGPP